MKRARLFVGQALLPRLPLFLPHEHLMHHSSAFSRLFAVLAGGAAIAAIGTLPACNIIAAATYIVHGPEKVPKLYTLDKTKKTVVFIDDRVPVVNSRVNRVKMGTTAERMLLNEGKMERMISSQDMLAVAEREKGSKLLGIVELGEKIEAEVVICVQMMSFSLTPDGEIFSPGAQMKVKVMDVTSKKRLWPGDEQEWYPMSISVPPKQGQPPSTLSQVEAEYSSLAERVGKTIANMFIEHEARVQDGRIDQ